MNIIDRVKNIITRPNVEWDIISSEPADSNHLLKKYVLPLAGLAAIAAFIGYAFIGFSMLGYRVSGINWGLYQALTVFLGSIISVYLLALIIDLLAPSFDSEKNFNRSFQLVAYSYTPSWVGGLLAIIPALSIVGVLFGLYGLYLLYLGIPKLKKTPADKHVGYFVVSIIVAIIVYIIVGWILGTILMNVFGLSYGIGRWY